MSLYVIEWAYTVDYLGILRTRISEAIARGHDFKFYS
jgi:hypothetical protein